MKEKGTLYLDLFGGTGGVSRALAKLGFRSVIWDTQQGPEYNMLLPGVEKRLKKLIRSGRVRGICFATPCTSFSLARNRTNNIRSKEHPWGNPWPRKPISSHDAESLDVGNKLMRMTIRLVHVCLRCNVPFCFENPAFCRTFDLPEWQALIRRDGVHEVVFDQCSCGTRWKKPTRLVFGCIDPTDLGLFDGTRCHGKKVCDFSHKPHIQLTGSSASGVPMTRLAQEYPKRMAMKIAKIISSKQMAQR